MGIRVYVSSTLKDLRAERDAVVLALQRAGYDPLFCEKEGAQEKGLAEYCAESVRSCEAYVLIVGWRYGYVPAGADVSITEHELRTAIGRRDDLRRQERNFPVLTYLADDATAPALSLWERIRRTDAVKQLDAVQAFRGRIKGELQFTPSPFTGADNLTAQVVADLTARLAAVSRPVELPPDLLVTLDRERHATYAQTALPISGQAKLPAVFFVYGAKDQGHNLFTQRLAQKELRLAGMRTPRIPWMSFPGAQGFAAQMHGALDGRLHGAAADDARVSMDRIAGADVPVFVRTEVEADDWSEQRRAELREYVLSWFQPPFDRLRVQVVVAIEIRRAGADVRQDLEAITKLPEVKKRVACVPELDDVRENEFRDWVESAGLSGQIGVPKATEFVRRMYGAKATWPFEDLLSRVPKVFQELLR